MPSPPGLQKPLHHRNLPRSEPQPLNPLFCLGRSRHERLSFTDQVPTPHRTRARTPADPNPRGCWTIHRASRTPRFRWWDLS